MLRKVTRDMFAACAFTSITSGARYRGHAQMFSCCVSAIDVITCRSTYAILLVVTSYIELFTPFRYCCLFDYAVIARLRRQRRHAACRDAMRRAALRAITLDTRDATR